MWLRPVQWSNALIESKTAVHSTTITRGTSRSGLSQEFPLKQSGTRVARLASSVIVYGTTREASANRSAAEQLQASYREHNLQDVPVHKDFEATDGNDNFISKAEFLVIRSTVRPGPG
jgi:hypothetical protein